VQSFLDVPETDWIVSNDLAFAIRDGFPVTDGHTLVITRRLVASWFDATPAERAALLDLVDQVRRRLDETHRPDGYNVGVNVGAAAGQTVPHLHLHVIPRYRGDVPDPRGGVRHVIPWKGNYRRAPALATGTAADPFLRHIRPLFAGATDIAIIAAFVQDSGLELLREPVFGALRQGARVRLITGDYLNITQATALRRLLDWMEEWAAHETSDDGEVGPGAFEARVVEVAEGGTIASFHPKSWRFEGDGFGIAFVGSSNVSRTALREEWSGICAWSATSIRSLPARPRGVRRLVDGRATARCRVGGRLREARQECAGGTPAG
jgi:diadenosine tetraphosphate (Ap4A) HIT family hydrolase